MDSSVLQAAAHFVVGGVPAPEGAWPWMAGLYYLGQYRCGAILIDNQVRLFVCLFPLEIQASVQFMETILLIRHVGRYVHRFKLLRGQKQCP